ncbi:MAG: PilZ domain-containing protein, partial [Spirochaetales bacterium]
CECNVSGNLFVLEKGKDGTYQRNQQGLKCCIEDVSEYGALVRIGGKGKSRLHVSLQFELDEKPVIMYGIVRGVEYNAQLNISRLHFECLKMNPEIKDNILSYVYKSLTERPIYEGGIF